MPLHCSNPSAASFKKQSLLLLLVLAPFCHIVSLYLLSLDDSFENGNNKILDVDNVINGPPIWKATGSGVMIKELSRINNRSVPMNKNIIQKRHQSLIGGMDNKDNSSSSTHRGIRNMTTTYTNRSIQKFQQQRPSPTTRPVFAILHIGLHKTATSTIQHAIYNNNEKDEDTTKTISWLQSLLLQNSIFPVKIKAAKLCEGEHMKFDASDNCQPTNDHVSKHLTNFVQDMEYHSKHNHNVIVSNEFLGIIRPGGCNHVVWDYLRSTFLHKFDTTIVVVGYRRYFEWVLSYYRQQSYTQFDIANLSFVEVLDATTESLAVSRWRARFHSIHPTKAEIELYRNQGFQNIQIFNMHDQTESDDILINFLCGATIATTNTASSFQQQQHKGNDGKDTDDLCDQARKMSLSRQHIQQQEGHRDDNDHGLDSPGAVVLKQPETVVMNKFEYDEEYYYLVAGFNEDCWDDDDCSTRAYKQIKRFNEKKLNQTILDLPRMCFSPAQKDWLLNISLEFEKELLPNWYESRNGKIAHQQKFENFVQQGKFCSLDVRTVLKMPVWSHFLKERLTVTQQEKPKRRNQSIEELHKTTMNKVG